MAKKKFTSLSQEATLATSKFFKEHNTVTNKWTYTLGSDILSFVSANGLKDFVTVGTGGTYASIELAIAAGQYNLKILTSISTTKVHNTHHLNIYLCAGVVLSLYETSGYVISMGNATIIGEGWVAGGTSSTSLPQISANRTSAGSFGALRGCNIYNCQINFPSASAPVVDYTNLYSCKINCQGANKHISGAYVNFYSCWFTAAGNMYNPFHMASIFIKDAYFSGETSLTSEGFYIQAGAIIENATVVGTGTYFTFSGTGTFRNIHGTNYDCCGGNWYDSDIFLLDKQWNIYDITCYNCNINGDLILTGTNENNNYQFYNCAFAGNTNFTDPASLVISGGSVAGTLTVAVANAIINNQLTISGAVTFSNKNIIADIIATGAVTVSGAGDSLKLTGKLLSTLTLATGVDNCDINVGVTTADAADGSNTSIIDNSTTLTNNIKSYKLT